MKLNLKMLAVSAALLGLLAAGAALPASATGPLNAAAALSLPWSAAAVESVETGSYASTMTVGTQQQLSPVILPAKAARKATVTFLSNDSTIVNVTSEGVAQAVGVGTAQVIASADGVSCVYTITTELDESMIVKEMDITLASSTIAVGETTSLSLGVLPSSASNYANVSLSSSDPAVATVNNFGKVTGVAPGTATITATCGDVSASATVKVVNSGADRQSIDLNTSYVVLKPGASRTITGKVTPSSASQSLTFKSNDTKVATVSAKGVITAVGTGATSIVVSNGTASASVTVIVNRNASSSGNGGDSTDSSNGEVITDPVVEAIEADGTDEVTFAQREVPTITGEMLNALRLNGKTLVFEADNYTILIAGRDVDIGVRNCYANPREVGVDRLINAVSAMERYGKPLIIVDIGTATTFDAIDAEGAYQGGAIFPGLKVAMEALFLKASKLPRVDIEMPEHAIGKTTVRSMQSGAVRGYVGALTGIITDIQKELGGNARVVATGGMGRMMAEYCPLINEVDPSLTLEGLRLIYQHNKDAFRGKKLADNIGNIEVTEEG